MTEHELSLAEFIF